METYHSVFRLLTEIKETNNDTVAALELADHTKARVLPDRVENSAVRRRLDLDIEVRKRADELSTRLIEGDEVVKEGLSRLERSVTLSSRRVETQSSVARGSMENIDCPANTTIVSYFFKLDGGLRAYVIERAKPVRIVKLSLPEKEAETLAETVRAKIRDKVFSRATVRRS